MKAKIKHVRIELEDGTIVEHDGGMLNVSRNYRTAHGTCKIIQEWFEHVITWHTPVEVIGSKPPVEETPTGLQTEELAKDPRFAGIADGRVYYRKPVPITVELPAWIDNLFDDINEGYGNGQH